MLRSGFLIFILPPYPSITSSNTTSVVKRNKHISSLQIQITNLILSKHLPLYLSINKPKYQMNTNTLKYISIKLALIYKDFKMLSQHNLSLINHDTKVSNLLMNYILNTADITYILENKNDNFFIFVIKQTITFLIQNINKRIPQFQHTINEEITSNNLYYYYNKYPFFKEIIIYSKYLDILRLIENEIFVKRNVIKHSLKQLIQELQYERKYVHYCNSNDTYYIQKIFCGHAAKGEHYLNKRIINNNNNSGNVSKYKTLLKKLIIEYYAFKILEENTQLYYICITLLKHNGINPNVFFKNICYKTTNKPLRRFFIEHLIHSSLTNENDITLFELMLYIETHFPNSSFQVEYRKQTTNTYINYIYYPSIDNEANTYSYVLKRHSNITDTSFTYEQCNKKHNMNMFYEGDAHSYHYDMGRMPLLHGDTAVDVRDMFSKHDMKWNELYNRIHMNEEVNDFAENKNTVKYTLNYIDNKYYKLFKEFNMKFVFPSNEAIQSTEHLRINECLLCKQYSPKNTGINFNNNNNKTNNGYSNLCIENLKYFTKDNITRLKLNVYLKETHTPYANNNSKTSVIYNTNSYDVIKSEFNYIKGYHIIKYIKPFIHTLLTSKEVMNVFKTINTIYFTMKTHNNDNDSGTKEIYLLSSNYFVSNCNDWIQMYLFDVFAEKGVLFLNEEDINEYNVVRLLRNEWFDVKLFVVEEYKKYCQRKGKFEWNNWKVSSKKENVIRSKLDECFERYVLDIDGNHYLMEILFDLGILNANVIYSENKGFDFWRNMLCVSKLGNKNEVDGVVYEIAIENMNVFNNNETKEIELAIIGMLVYLKNNNIPMLLSQSNINNKKYISLKHIEQLYSLVYSVLPKHNSQSISKLSSPTSSHSLQTLTNDITLFQLISNYFPYSSSSPPSSTLTTPLSFVDDFELMLENGKTYEAYTSSSLPYSQLLDKLYTICLNNLLDSLIFESSLFLLQINSSNLQEQSHLIEEFSIQIRSATRILQFEIDLLSNNNANTKEQLYTFIKHKNKYNPSTSLSPIETELLEKYQLLVSQFKQLITKSTNDDEHKNLIFVVLKRLEGATWRINDSTDDESENAYNWALVNSFCHINNYNMSLVSLHDYGRHNNWFLFLFKAQELNCTPSSLMVILNAFFTDEAVKKHLQINLQRFIKEIEHNEEEKKEEEEKVIIEHHEQINEYDNNESDVLFKILIPQNTNNDNEFKSDLLYYIDNTNINSNLHNATLLLNSKESLFYNYDIEYNSLITNDDNNLEYKLNLLTMKYYSLYIYITFKEIITSSSFTLATQTHTLLSQLHQNTFTSNTSHFTLFHLKQIISFLLINTYTSILEDASSFFPITDSWYEFILFIRKWSNNDIISANTHLYLCKQLQQNEDTSLPYISFFHSLTTETITNMLNTSNPSQKKELLNILYYSKWN